MCDTPSRSVAARFLTRIAIFAALLGQLLLGWVSTSQAQQTDSFDELNKKVAALIYYGQFSEALPLAQHAVNIAKSQFGLTHQNYGLALNSLAEVYRILGRYEDAEPLYKRSINAYETSLGPDDFDVAVPLLNLANLYLAVGRENEAEPLLQRSIALLDKSLDPDATAKAVAKDLSELGRVILRAGNLASALNTLGEVYRRLERYADAETMYRRSLAIREAAYGPDDSGDATALHSLGLLHLLQGDYAVAQLHLKRSIEILEQTVGADSPALAASLHDLASAYFVQHHYAEADEASERALKIFEKALGPTHPSVLKSLNLQAESYLAQGRYADALSIVRLTMSRRGAAKKVAFPAIFAAREHNLIDSLPAAAESYEVAQRASSSAAAIAVSKLAARFSVGNSELAQHVRKDQDLAVEADTLDKRLIAALSRATAERDAAVEDRIRRRSAAIETERQALQQFLNQHSPDYVALSKPEPLSLKDTQELLANDEALIVFDSDDTSYAWTVTKSDVRWVRIELGTKALSDEVAALRCGLDYTGSWTGSRCSDVLKVTYTHADHIRGKPLPFDLGRAHELYEALFSPIEDLIKGKQLLIVSTGPLTQLPFQVLVTEPQNVAIPASFVDYRKVPWLARRQAITVLPAVSSLKALRQFAKKSYASDPYIGFGNPLLDGDPAKYKDDAAAAELAREERCPPSPQMASLSDRGGGVRAMAISDHSVANIADIRRQAPLPETAEELCEVAQGLGVDPAMHVFLGATATEAKIKQLSEDGTLKRYKVVHFATHGALAGQISLMSEPGLVLTPPATASDTDDGYLTASEVAALKLDADWVILSACNTAAGGAEGAEALSGLARAFFYAGARSLLVSHWAVDSNATVELITAAVTELEANPMIGRADALRRSMLTMIKNGKVYEAHPAYWAPFVLVGEGMR
jgi:CHAT domain-containing protein/tetratricopeptide (TPR) repeat protein